MRRGNAIRIRRPGPRLPRCSHDQSATAVGLDQRPSALEVKWGRKRRRSKDRHARPQARLRPVELTRPETPDRVSCVPLRADGRSRRRCPSTNGRSDADSMLKGASERSQTKVLLTPCRQLGHRCPGPGEYGTLGSPAASPAFVLAQVFAAHGVCVAPYVRLGKRLLPGPAPTSWRHLVWSSHDVGPDPGDERLGASRDREGRLVGSVGEHCRACLEAV
jgi:hypothetical protein